MSNFLPRAGAAAALLLTASALHAQTAPDAGQLLRDANRSPTLSVPARPLDSPTPTASEPETGPRVQVAAFRLSGVTLLPEPEVQARLAGFVGQPAAMADLRRAADSVAALYRERGYLVRAYLPEQTLRDGVVAISVLEGRLADVRVDQALPGRNISPDQVRATMMARQKLGEPVRADHIQRAIGLLDATPGLSASSLLEPGEQQGESRLVVSVRDAQRITGQMQLDNAGSKASGEWRASAGLSLNSPSGRGDQAQFYLSKSSGSIFGSASYSLPLGHDGLRANLNTSRLSYGYTLGASRYTGAASVLGVSLAYPLLRAAAVNLNVSLGQDHKRFDNAVSGIRLNDKTLDVSTLGIAGDASDGFFGGGLTQFGLMLTLGDLDLADNAADLAADQQGPQRQGKYHKLSWTLGRVQRITAADTLLLTYAGQQASRNLDSAEKFSATGQGGVRAYSSAEPSGDNGQFLSLEWRHQVSALLTLTAYHERARLQRDHTAGPGTLNPNRFSLAGSGLGLHWGHANLVLVRAALAWRQGDNPVRNPGTGADSDGTRRNPRAYLALLRVF